VKIAKGVRPCRIPKGEVPALPGDPEPPLPLAGLAKAEWDRMIPILRDLGVSSASDGAALAVYCQTYMRWRQALDEIERKGLTVEDGRGRPKVNPLLSVANQLEATMTKLLREFGLTPASRAAVNAEPPNHEEDDIESFKASRLK
jgi:P27 family predicted phage terminase small subunit